MSDANRLESELRAALEGEVRFDAGSRALYATDASNYRQIPIGVVYPRHEQDVIRTVDLCRRHGAPILSRGAGTSLAGQTCNEAVILDFSKHMNRILRIDAKNHVAEVEPGVILDHLRAEAEKQGLTFGPDPATHSRCTLGGMIGNNSCGIHALWGGKTVDNVESLDILTYDGLTLTVGRTSDTDLDRLIKEGNRKSEIYTALRDLRDKHAEQVRARYPKIPRRVSGYNLDALLPENGFHVARSLVGTEGTCVIILRARLRLIPNPKTKTLLVLGFDTIYDAADAVPTVLKHQPIGLEGMDVDMVYPLKRYQGYEARIAHLPPGNGWLMVEFGADDAPQAQAKARVLADSLTGKYHLQSHKVCTDPHETEDIWTIRESALAATAFIPGQRDRLEGWEDTAVPPERLGVYLRELRALYDKFGYRGAFYGHFGDGCLHTRIDFDFETPQGREQTRAFLNEAADLVVRYGGSLSGEHGDGQARAELLPKMFGDELVQAFWDFKTIWDPQNRMNPGKVVKPAGIFDNLRMGENFRPTKPTTHFHYPQDQNSFVRATLRCVGVGKCRREEGGLMCPSYVATRDEKDSTRGRAHLLFEMLQGDVIKDGWKNEAVKESLDLCLACKGCKSDCPTNVDMASYKAEFLSHYYEGHLRPRRAVAFAFIFKWLRFTTFAPWLVNFFTQTWGLRHVLLALAGASLRRRIPRLSPKPFRAQFLRRENGDAPRRPTDQMRVLLWPDTFNNHFHSDTAMAAVDVLEHLGYAVEIPRTPLCCGRPLYDYGYLKEAKDLLKQILDALREDIMAGTPIIGLEPSCVAVFRDELLNFFPDDPAATRLSKQTFLLSEFIHQSGVKLPLTYGSAVLQVHCHQKSVLKAGVDADLLTSMGVQVKQPESGCCGMAGAFGFEPDHLKVSQTLGEKALLPAVRQSPSDHWIIANGFSCREQITQGTGRPVHHIADILKKALSK